MEKTDFRRDILPLKDKIYRLALRITNISEEAEDIVQDTMLKVWSMRTQWKTLKSVEAWCMTVARNLALDRTGAASAENTGITEDLQIASAGSSPHDELERKEGLDIVMKLVDRLPEKQKTALHLRDVEGKTYKEIAEIMQMSEENVKTNIFRARQKIKENYLKIMNYGL